jgi:hypothetical protein
VHHVHISVLGALVIYFAWLFVRLPIMLLAYRFHRNPIAQAILQFG